jgi:hypothetical protein
MKKSTLAIGLPLFTLALVVFKAETTYSYMHLLSRYPFALGEAMFPWLFAIPVAVLIAVINLLRRRKNNFIGAWLWTTLIFYPILLFAASVGSRYDS